MMGIARETWTKCRADVRITPPLYVRGDVMFELLDDTVVVKTLSLRDIIIIHAIRGGYVIKN